jgi:type II secretory pathway pseudopilin PulG
MVRRTTLGNHRDSRQAGFTYLLVLGFVFVLLLSLTIASEHIATTIQREREAELLFVGQQYRNAIASYYQKSPNGIKQLPLKLEDLLEDRRSLTVQHHLRKRYRDPMAEIDEWGLVRDGQGQISGVYSLSQGTPMLTQEDTRFAIDASANGDAKTYSSWKFVFKPNNANALAIPPQDAATGSTTLQPTEMQN